MTTKTFQPSRSIIPIPDSIKERYKINTTGDRPEYARILLSGLGGQGKTAFIGTASRRAVIEEKETLAHSNVLLIEFDPDGHTTLSGMNSIVDKVDSPNEKELQDLLRFLATSNEAQQYDVVAIDAYNKLQDIEGDSVLKTGILLSNKRNRSRIDEETLEIQDYSRLYKRCRIINNILTAINKHIIVTCIMGIKDHPLDMDKAKENRRQLISLALDGKMSHILSTQFSLHGIMSKEASGNNIRVDTVFSQFNSEAKTRFRHEHTQQNITFPKLLELIGIDDPAFNKIQWEQDYMGFLPKYTNTNGR